MKAVLRLLVAAAAIVVLLEAVFRFSELLGAAAVRDLVQFTAVGGA